MISPFNVQRVIIHQKIHDPVGTWPAVKNVSDNVQMIDGEAFDQGGEHFDKCIGTVKFQQSIDDILMIGNLIVILILLHMDQFIQNISVLIRHRFTHFGTRIFGGEKAGNLDQLAEDHTVPFFVVAALFFHHLQLFDWIVDQRADFFPVDIRERFLEKQIHFLTDHTGTVIQNMAESFIFSVQVAHKMLRAFWKTENCFQIDDLPTYSLLRRIFFCKQFQIFFVFHSSNLHIKDNAALFFFAFVIF